MQHVGLGSTRQHVAKVSPDGGDIGRIELPRLDMSAGLFKGLMAPTDEGSVCMQVPNSGLLT